MKKIQFETKNGKPYYGGSLYLSGTGITSLPEGLTVGGYLYLSGTGITDPKYTKIDPDNHLFTWLGEKFIKVDGIFAQVLSKKKNVYRVKKIGDPKEFFIVTNDKKYAHGDTIKEAKQDLIFKISDRNKSDYENLTRESAITYEKTIECYRVITGACSFGTKNFVTERLTQRKKQYTISEVITLTKGEWGNSTFAEFFKK